MRIAALDLGSNSFHLLVADVPPGGGMEAVVRDKEMLRLGSLVASTGALGEPAIDSAVEVVKRFAAMAESLGAEEVVACGTSALRQARDTPRLLARIRAETGIDVVVIGGDEEARLIFEAVRRSVVIDPGPAMAMDLGGGSLEIMVGDQGRLAWSVSLELGVARLTAEVVRSDPLSPGDRRRLARRVERMVAPHSGTISSLSPVTAIGSSGTLLTLIRLAAGRRPSSTKGADQPAEVNQLTVDLQELRELEDDLLRQTCSQRASLPGVDARRADLLPAGIVTCTTVMEMAGIDHLTGCEWALREGMILDAAGSRLSAGRSDEPAALRRRSVLDLCERYRWPEAHSKKVARLALELFDGTASRHGLGGEDRELLEFGALLHDVGEHVSTDRHELHGSYLIQHGRLRGFSPEEIAVLASLARFHPRGSPKASFAPWAGLSRQRRSRTEALIALLQVADALDRGHGGPVRDVHVRAPSPRRIVIEVEADGDIDLERYALRRKGQLLERLFDSRIELVNPPAAGQLAG